MNIPAEALNQHLAIFGRTGSGKTFAAKAAIVEPLLEQRKRVCIIDPTGAWFGLKSSADGKHPGFEVCIFGGEHADVPITDNMGAAIAELIAVRNLPCIIDLSDFGVGERNRFAAAFAETILRKNRQPLHMIIDEADEFMPLGAAGSKDVSAAVMLNRFDRIVRRGRRLGFRVTMISQRPAVLHTNARSSAAGVILMRLSAPQDRKAVEDWIRGQADIEKGKEVLDSLASLKRGEGWLWFPEGGILRRGVFPKIKTFDSSATPDDGGSVPEPQRIAEVDLSGIQAEMASAVAEADANDPKKLRARIAELERAGKVAAPPAVDVEAIRSEERANTTAAIEIMLAGLHAHIHNAASALRELDRAYTDLEGELQRDGCSAPPRPRESTQWEAKPAKAPPIDPKKPLVKDDTITATQQRVLDALAMWTKLGQDAPTVEQVAFVARINPKGGHFSNTVGPLSTKGYVRREGGQMFLTPIGKSACNWPDTAISLAAYHDNMKGLLKTGAQVAILEAVISLKQSLGKDIPVESIGGYTGINPAGGHFSNSIGPLSTLGLIERRNGTVRATPLLFPDGLR